jgi:hypothetical protein
MIPRMSRNPTGWLKTLAAHQQARNISALDFAIEVYLDRQQKSEPYDEAKHKGRGMRYDREGKVMWIPDRYFPPRGIWAPRGDTLRLWYPFPEEVRPCCEAVRLPDFKFPYVLQRHCRSARHVAMLFNVDERDIVARTSKRSRQKRCVECKRFLAADLYICGPCGWKQRNALDKAA